MQNSPGITQPIDGVGIFTDFRWDNFADEDCFSYIASGDAIPTSSAPTLAPEGFSATESPTSVTTEPIQVPDTAEPTAGRRLLH